MLKGSKQPERNKPMAEEKAEKKKLSGVAQILALSGVGSILVFKSILFIRGIRHNVLSSVGIVGLGVLLGLFYAGFLDLVALSFARRRSTRRGFWIYCFGLLIMLPVLTGVYLSWPDSENWKPYTFEGELAAIDAKRAIPITENAARLYETLMAGIDRYVETPKLLYSFPDEPIVLTGPWKVSQYLEFAVWLNDYEDLIREAAKVCQIKRCAFKIEPYMYTLLTSDRPSKLSFCARVVLADANRDIGEGRIKSGFEKYLYVMQIAKHRYQQPTRFDFLAGFDIDEKVLRSLCKVVVGTGIGGEDAKQIVEAVEMENNWPVDWPAILDVEKLWLKNQCGLYYEVNNEGKTRFARKFYTRLARKYLPVGYPLSRWEIKLADKIGPVIFAMEAPYRPESAGKVVDQMYQKFYEAAASDFDWNKLEGYEQERLKEMRHLHGIRSMFLVTFSAPDLSELYDSYMQQVAMRRSCRLIIALRQYKDRTGQWPDDLNEIRNLVGGENLIDPVNNDSFVYKLTSENFTLYSKGKNNIDEGGEHDAVFDPNSFEMKVNVDDWLFWPPRSRKAKEENTDVEQQ
jgi:hypothetical protein